MFPGGGGVSALDNRHRRVISGVAPCLLQGATKNPELLQSEVWLSVTNSCPGTDAGGIGGLTDLGRTLSQVAVLQNLRLNRPVPRNSKCLEESQIDVAVMMLPDLGITDELKSRLIPNPLEIKLASLMR